MNSADAPQKPKCNGRCRQVPNVNDVPDDFLAITEFALIWWHQIHIGGEREIARVVSHRCSNANLGCNVSKV